MFAKILKNKHQTIIFIFLTFVFTISFLSYIFFISKEIPIEGKDYIKFTFLILYIMLIFLSRNLLYTATILFFIFTSIGIRWWIFYWIPQWKFYQPIAITLFDVIGILILFCIVISKLGGGFKLKRIPLSSLLTFQIVIFFFSSFVSYDKNFSFLYIFLWASSLALFFTIWIISDIKKNFEKFLMIILISLAIREFIGFLQLMFGFIPFLKAFDITSQQINIFWSTRIKGGFTHPNAFAGILSLALSVSVGMILSKNYSKKINMLLLFFCIASILEIFFTFSRTGYISLFIILLCFFVYYAYIKKKFLTYFIIFLIFFILSLMLIKIFLPAVFLRITSIFWGERDISISSRFYLWKNSIKLLKEHLITGIGINQFVFQKFSLGLAHAHNYYINTLLETGILGLVILLSILWRGIFTSFKILLSEKDINNKYLWLSILAGWILITVHFIFTGFWIANFASVEIKYLFTWFAVSFLIIKYYRKNENRTS